MSLPTAPANSAERAAHTARVGAGQIAARDQRIGGQRAVPVAPPRLALPLGGLAVGGVEPRARHLAQNARLSLSTVVDFETRGGVLLVASFDDLSNGDQAKIDVGSSRS